MSEPQVATSVASSRYAAWLPIALLLALVLLVFGRIVQYEFILLDDGPLIYQNPHVVGAFPACQGGHIELYIPLVYNLWAMLAQVAGGGEWALGSHLDPLVYHLAPAPTRP